MSTIQINPVYETNVLNNATVLEDLVVSGTTVCADNDQTVRVVFNNQAYTTTVYNDRWHVVIPSSVLRNLTSGNLVITAELITSSSPDTITIDRRNPHFGFNVLFVDNVLNFVETQNAQPITGWASSLDEGGSLSLSLNGKTYSTTIINGVWRVTVPQIDLAALTNLTAYTISATLTNLAGNAASATTTFMVNRTLPKIVLVRSLNDDGIINAKEVLLPLTVSGTVENAADGSLIDILFNGKRYKTHTSNHQFTLSIPSIDLVNIPNRYNMALAASVTNQYGNITTTSISYRVDRIIPVVAIFQIANNDILNLPKCQQNQVINGTVTEMDNNQIVTVKLNGQSYISNVLDGNWSVTVPSSDLLKLLNNTTYTVDVIAINAIKNQGVGSRNINVKRICDLHINSLAGDNNLTLTKSQQQQSLTGYVVGIMDDGGVTVTLNGKSYTSSIVSSQFGVNIPSADLMVLRNNSTYSIIANASDLENNKVGPITELIYTKR